MNSMRAGIRPVYSLVLAVISLLILFVLPSAAHADGALYGCSGDGEYFKLDLATGNWTTLSYSLYGATEIEYDPISGRAFASSESSFVGIEFNPLTGAAFGGVAYGAAYTGLEFVGSTLYGAAITEGCGLSELRTLDPATGAFTLIGSTGLGPITGLAYDAGSAKMYGITGCASGNSSLVTLNLTIGAATVIGSVGFEAGALEFGPDGNLYGGGSNFGTRYLYRIDPVSAASTLVGSGSGFGEFTGLMLGPACHSAFSQIQLAGTFTSPAYDLTQSPAMTSLGDCHWQVTRHFEPGSYLCKFVTNGALDSPPDYGGDDTTSRPIPGGPYPTMPATGPGHAILLQVMNPDDYTFTLDESDQTWSATAAHGQQYGFISGSVDFELGFGFPPYPVATVELFRDATLLDTMKTNRYSPYFSLYGLASGDYRVRVSARCYAPAEVTPITVTPLGADIGAVHLTLLPSTYSRMDLVGDFNGFTIGANPMTQPVNCFWSTDQTLGPGEFAFKFATNGALDAPPDYGAVTPFTFTVPAQGDVELGTGPATALHVSIDHPGKYHFNLDERNLTFQIFEMPPPPPDLDINRIRMFVTPDGSFAYDPTTGSPGLEFPKGSGKTAVFSAGLWVTAGSLVSISEYTDEFQRGAMVGGVNDDPSRPEYKVYKLNRAYPNSADRDAALADYNAGAIPHGAPVVVVLPNGQLDIPGDQMLWHVYNDADPSRHISGAGSTAPLGLEIQQTAFAYNQPGPLGNTVFMKFKILNQGSNTLSDLRIGMWGDPDLGDFRDDLIGCDPPRGLGFCYNGAPHDSIYGFTPPAVGFDLLQGPLVPGSGRLGMTSFIKYRNGTDPISSTETIHYLQGLNPDGSPIVNPITSLPTPFMVSGDPVAATGWLDTTPGDRRMLQSSGPIAMAPGDVQEIVVAILLGEGSDRLASITALKTSDDVIQQVFDSGFDPSTAVEVSLVSSEATPGHAHLIWNVASHGARVTVYRAEPDRAWLAIGTLSPDGTGRVEFDDAAVRAGARYGYRLGVQDGATEAVAGEVWLDIPVTLELALHGLRPNPAVGEMWVSFSLPNADPATLELLDLGGRRVWMEGVGALGPGTHSLRIGSGSRLPPGLYMLRLRQANRTLIAKAAIIR